MTPAQVTALIRAVERTPGPENHSWAGTYANKLRDVLSRWRRESSVRRRDLRASVSASWTSEAYRSIQRLKRGGNSDGSTEALVKRLDLYMKSFALRAPSMPPKVRNLETGREFPTLYRGVRLSPRDAARLEQTGTWQDRGYMAFTRSRSRALLFGNAVLKLDVRNVQRGTPWMWFAGLGESRVKNEWNADLERYTPRRTGFIHKNFDPGNATVAYENEVLLPPGVIRVKSVSHLTKPSGQVYSVYECDYRPDPAYLRRR